MFMREISPELVKRAVRKGEVIAMYPDDQPYPSFLLLYKERNQVLHVVVGLDDATKACYVVTVYQPEPALWSDDFRNRRQR
jgi:hypothetical protein